MANEVMTWCPLKLHGINLYLKKNTKLKSNDTSENPNSPHLIRFLMGYLNQISLDPIVLLCNAVMPPPLPGDEVILPHTVATMTVSGGNPIWL